MTAHNNACNNTPQHLPRIVAGKQRTKQLVLDAQHGQSQRAERGRGRAEAVEEIARDEGAIHGGQRQSVSLLVHAAQTHLERGVVTNVRANDEKTREWNGENDAIASIGHEVTFNGPKLSTNGITKPRIFAN